MSDLLPAYIALAHAEPPLLAWQANPAHDGWQTEMSSRQSAYDALAAHVADLQVAVDGAQDAVNNLIEPEPGYTENTHGAMIETKAHKEWATKIAPLKATLQTAINALAQPQEDKTKAQKLRDDWVLVEPLSQIVVENPAYDAWKQQIAAARTGLESTHWNTVYDGNGALAQQALQAAQGRLAAAEATLVGKRNQLAQAPAQLGALGTQAAAQAADAESARQVRDRAQGDVNALIQQQQALVAQQPPATLTQPNPDYAAWQARMMLLQQALDAARANAAGPQQAVADAQAAVDDQNAHEPDPGYIENSHGAQIETKAHKDWARKLATLYAALDAALAAAAPAQQAVAAAQAAWGAGNAGAPPPTQVVDNPAYQTWTAQTAQVAAALAGAQAQLVNATAELDSTMHRLAATQAALQAAQATVSSLPEQIATLEASLPALQQALNQANAAQALEAARVAVLLGQPAPDAVVIEVFNDLFTRLSACADAAHNFDAATQQSDEELWRIQARIDELTRKITDAEAAKNALNAAQTAYEHDSKALDIQTAKKPRPPKPVTI